MVKRRMIFGGGGPKDGLAMDANFPDHVAAEDHLAAGSVNFPSDHPGMADYYAIDRVQMSETDSVICWLYRYEGEFKKPTEDPQGA